MYKDLYEVIAGKYKYRNQWNNIPESCRFFYSTASRIKLTLKGLIAKHLKLSEGQYTYIYIGGGLKLVKYIDMDNSDKCMYELSTPPEYCDMCDEERGNGYGICDICGRAMCKKCLDEFLELDAETVACSFCRGIRKC